MFDSCTDTLSDQLEQVQRQALLAITRAYKHTSQANLLKELGLETLQERRHASKRVLLFKMKSHITPSYLSDLLTPFIINRNTQQTRQKDTIIIPHCKRKSYFLKSFLPSSIKLWNNLPKNLISITELDKFKKELFKYNNTTSPSKTILSFNTEGHLHILRMRLGLSGLNWHRKKYHFITHSTCLHCRSRREDVTHYLLQCTAFAAHRGDMFGRLGLLLPQCNHLLINLTKKNMTELCDILLYGTSNVVVDKDIFKIVAKYVIATKRFDYIQ